MKSIITNTTKGTGSSLGSDAGKIQTAEREREREGERKRERPKVTETKGIETER